MAKDPKEMSVEEILAACRQADGEGGGAVAEAPADEPAPASSEAAVSATDESQDQPAEEAPAEAAEASQPAASGKKPSEMSVAEMLAAARGEMSKPAEKKPAAKPAAKAKAADKASPKTPAKKPAAAKTESPKDTASILAAARKSDRPGPMSKAEAAAKSREREPAEPAKKKSAVPPMPERPDYARPSAAAQTAEQDRRGFFGSLTKVFFGSSLAVGFTSLAVTHLLWLLGFARFMFPNILTEPPTKFKVGFPGDYAPGQVETKYKSMNVWIVRYEYEGQPQIYAIQTVCTHLGCTPNWLEGEQKFKCPCHGSGFYKDGINFEGPAPRPLERFAIRVADDGQLEVDKSRTFLEEKGEWKDTNSFVPV